MRGQLHKSVPALTCSDSGILWQLRGKLSKGSRLHSPLQKMYSWSLNNLSTYMQIFLNKCLWLGVHGHRELTLCIVLGHFIQGTWAFVDFGIHRMAGRVPYKQSSMIDTKRLLSFGGSQKLYAYFQLHRSVLLTSTLLKDQLYLQPKNSEQFELPDPIYID